MLLSERGQLGRIAKIIRGKRGVHVGTLLSRLREYGRRARILTTAQQFGVASGVAIIGAVFYTRLGVTRASAVSATELAMAVDAVVVLAAAALTLLLPRRAAARRPAARRPATDQTPAVRQYTTEPLH